MERDTLSKLIGEELVNKLRDRSKQLGLDMERILSKIIWDFLDSDSRQSDFIDIAYIIKRSRTVHNWTQKIKKRDNLSCQYCGSKYLVHAHHIIPIKDIILLENIDNINKIEKSKLLNDLKNGVTLCVKCHRKEHKSKKRK